MIPSPVFSVLRRNRSPPADRPASPGSAVASPLPSLHCRVLAVSRALPAPTRTALTELNGGLYLGALSQPLRIIGSPTVTLEIASNVPVEDVTLFASLRIIGGTERPILPNGLVAPIRIARAGPTAGD